MDTVENTSKCLKQYWPHTQLQMFDSVAASSSFPQEMLKALNITLLKPGKSLESPQNFWPILLLNIDLKLYVKIIALRLVDMLPTLISPDLPKADKLLMLQEGLSMSFIMLRSQKCLPCF